MKVLTALDYFRPNISGLTIHAERLAQGLAERGHSVTVLTHRHLATLSAEERWGKVRILRAPVLARIGKALVSPTLLRLARREMAGAHLLHLHCPSVAAVPLAWLAKRLRLPLVVTYHCDLQTPPGALARTVEKIARASQEFALARAAEIVTYTEDYARNTPSLSRHLDRVEWVLPPVAEPPLTGRSQEEVRQRYAIRGQPVILFLGRFAEEKGLPHLISALPEIRRRFPQATLLLAGEKDRVPGERVGQRLAPLLQDPASGVVATGEVPPKEIGDLFAAADLLALPSTNSTESFGLVQVEAMLCGVPVVASDLPGVRQPVRMTGMGEIAPVGEPSALARQIIRVLEAPQTYRRPREAIRQMFSIDRTLSEYERVYRAAIEKASDG